jgi:hypothetical protein
MIQTDFGLWYQLAQVVCWGVIGSGAIVAISDAIKKRKNSK